MSLLVTGPKWLDNLEEDDTIQFKWETHTAAGASVDPTVAGTIRIYKNNSITERASASGITDTRAFDGLTGIHSLTIDTSDDTDAGFWVVNENYMAVLVGATIDGVASVNAVLAHFSTENRFHNMGAVSGDKPAADNFETMLDATGGGKLSLGQLNIVASANDPAIRAIGSGAGHGMEATGGATGTGLRATGGSTSGAGIVGIGDGDGGGIEGIASGGARSGISGIGSAQGAGMRAAGGSSGGPGLSAEGGSGSANGINAVGSVAGSGINTIGGSTGHGIKALGGATSGDGIHAEAQTAGDGIEAIGVGGGFDFNAELLVTEKDDIVDRTWDEDIEAAHGTDGTAGLLLRILGQGISNETRNANLLDQLRTITTLIEHQRGAHTHQPIGNVIFVDPVNGDTHANGNRGGISDPYLGVQDAHDNAVTDSNHDLLILLSGAAAGPTTLTEDVTLSKRYMLIRGPGRDFIWTRAGAGDTIAITADGVELSGFQLNTAAVGAGNGIIVTSADFFRADNLWINDTRGDAIELTDCDNFIIEDSVLQGSGASGSGHGIQVLAGAGQTGNYGIIRRNAINDVQGDGIQLDTTGGGSVDAPIVEHNTIQGCIDDGIDIVDAGVTDAFLHNNRLGNNATDIEDAGTNTIDLNNVAWLSSPLPTDLITAASVSAGAANKIADHTIRRSSATARASANGDAVDKRSLLGAESKLHNRFDTTTNPGSATVFEEDDSTEFYRQTLVTDANADPIVSADTV